MSQDDRSAGVLAVALTFLTLTWVMVPLRMYVRILMTRSFGIDDALLIFTQALFTMYISCQIGGWYHGTGRHRADLTPENNMEALRYWFFCEVLYVLTATFLKLAVGVFLLRIAIVKFHVWILRTLMVGSIVFGTAYLFVVLFQCQPISVFWTEAPGTAGKCLENNPVAIATYVASVINCLADWAFGILPMFIVWSLNMKKTTRVMIMCILGFASVGSTATIVRMFYIPDMLNGQDFLYATTNFAIWSTVEPAVGIIATSLATLRPLLRIVFDRIGLTLSYAGGNSQHWAPSHGGYIKTNDSALRPDESLTTTSAAGPKKSAFQSSGHKSRVSVQPIELAGITRTMEISLSSDDAAAVGYSPPRQQRM